jgi:hypothetical protein
MGEMHKSCFSCFLSGDCGVDTQRRVLIWTRGCMIPGVREIAIDHWAIAPVVLSGASTVEALTYRTHRGGVNAPQD